MPTPSSDIHIYSKGFIAMSVCAPVEAKREEVEAEANRQNPTGISSLWKIADEKFKDGSDNPHPCEQGTARLHWLLHC